MREGAPKWLAFGQKCAFCSFEVKKNGRMKLLCFLSLLTLAFNSMKLEHVDEFEDSLANSVEKANDDDDRSYYSDYDDDGIDDNNGDDEETEDPRPLILWCRRGRKKVCRYYTKCGKRWWKRSCWLAMQCSCECPKGNYYGCEWKWKSHCWKVLDRTFCNGKKICKCRPGMKGDGQDQ